MTIQSMRGTTRRNGSPKFCFPTGTVIAIEPVATEDQRSEENMKVPVFTTVGELIVILFDETRKLGLKTRERRLLVAYLLNDLLRRSSLSRAPVRA